jgi:hypothetical protein
MAFKIKDGVRIGTVDIFNNSAETLNLNVKDTNAGTGKVTINTASLGSTTYTQTLQAATGTIALTSDVTNDFGVVKIVNTDSGYTWVTTDNTTTSADARADTLSIVAAKTGSTYGIQVKVDAAADAIGIAHADTSTLSGAQGTAGIASITLDEMGHITAVTTATYLTTSKNVVGASNTATADAAATNGNVYLNHLANGSVSSAHKITGAGSTTVTSDASGNITITSTDNNTDTLQSVADDTGTTERFIHFVNSATGAQTAGSSANFKFTPGTTTGSPTLLIGGATGTSPVITTTSTGTVSVFNTNATVANAFGAATTVSIGASTGTTTVNNNLVVTGNLTVNGTSTIVNSTVTSVDDPVLILGGDTSTVEVTKDRGIEAKWNGTTLTMTNFIGAGTTTVTGTVASTTGYAVGDIITISGATGTEQSKLNGTWKIASVPNGTTFTFVVSSTVSAGTLTTTLGTTVKSKDAFFGLDQSTGKFTFIPQADNNGEVFSGTKGEIDAYVAFSNVTGATLQAVTDNGNTTNDDIQLNGSSLALAPATTAKIWKKAIAFTLNVNDGSLAADTWDKTVYRSAKYYIQATQGTKYYSSEINVIHDGTTAYMTEFSVLENNAMSWDATTWWAATISGNNLSIYPKITDAASTNVSFIIERTLFAV